MNSPATGRKNRNSQTSEKNRNMGLNDGSPIDSPDGSASKKTARANRRRLTSNDEIPLVSIEIYIASILVCKKIMNLID